MQAIASLTNGAYYQAKSRIAQDMYKNIDLQLTIAGDKIEVTALLAGLGSLFADVGAALSLLWFGRVPMSAR